MFVGSKNSGSGTKELAKRVCPVADYRPYVTHDVIDWLELCTSIYSDVQIFADEIFADGC